MRSAGRSRGGSAASLSDGKGEPGQVNSVSHGCPPARFKQVNILNTTDGPPDADPNPKLIALIDRIVALVRATKGAEANVTVRGARARANTRFAVNEISTSGRRRAASDSRSPCSSASAPRPRSPTSRTTARSTTSSAARCAWRGSRPRTPRTCRRSAGRATPRAKNAADPATVKLTPDARARAVGAALAAAETGKVQMAGFVNHASPQPGDRQPAPACGLSTTWTVVRHVVHPRAPTDGTGSGWAGSGAHRMADLDAAAIAKTAVDKATASAKPQRLEPGRYTRGPRARRGREPARVPHNSLDARRADEGRSFFSKRKPGDKLFPETITLRNDPTDAALGALPFDTEGFPPRRARVDRQGRADRPAVLAVLGQAAGQAAHRPARRRTGRRWRRWRRRWRWVVAAPAGCSTAASRRATS